MEQASANRLIGNRSFVALLCAQLLGFLNDNIIKMMASLLIVGAAGASRGGGALSLTSIVFLLPYLLFSGYAGNAADAFGNRLVLIVTKGAEVAIVLLAVGALRWGRTEPLLAVLFLLAAQATFFSPAKYSMVREIVPLGDLQRANGLLEIGRFGAIIVGTALGGVLLQSWDSNQGTAELVLVGISIAGLAATIIIAPDDGPTTVRQVRMNPWAEIGSGILLIARNVRLRCAVAGLCLFEAVGALLLLDIILIGHDELQLDSAATGLLSAFVGVGLVIGGLLAGYRARRVVEIGMVPWGVAGVGMTLTMLALWPHGFAATIAGLSIAGMCGAFCLVPLNAALQHFARPGERGKVVATNNFLSMASVMAVSSGLWLAQEIAPPDAWNILLFSGLAALGGATLMALFFPGYGAAAKAWSRTLLRMAGRRAVRHRAAMLAATLVLAIALNQRAAASELQLTDQRYRVVHAIFGEIGEFQQIVRAEGDRIVVESNLNVVVTVLFSSVTLHEVRSSSREVWCGQRLIAYRSTTLEDGAVTSIRGEERGDTFVVTGPEGTYVMPAGVVPMSPWSILLAHSRLLMSPETGGPWHVAITSAAPQSIDLGGRRVLASHFVASGDQSFELWYDGDQPVKIAIDTASGTVSFLRR